MYCIIPPDKEQAEINPNPIRTPIPMKSVHFLALVENAIVNLSVTQQFINQDSKPLEVFYSFPVSEDSVVSSLKVHLNDGSILTAKVKDAEKASETYQDALASGNTAVLGKVEEDNKTLTVSVGNLGPGDLVKVEFGLSFPLEGDLADWKLEIPKIFFPADERDVSCGVSIVVHSSEQIKNFSSSFEIDWVLSEDKFILQGDSVIKSLKDFPSKSIWFKYQAEASNKPKLIYQKYKNKYYGMIAFVPFDKSLKSLDDAYGQGEYIFLLDRSASMDGIRINIAKQATVLFLKSLPEDSYFNIVSFGSYYKKMYPNSVKSSSSNIDQSIEQVHTFSADMGGTKIYSPLEDIFTQPLIEGYSKTIFLITDGQVYSPESIIDLISQNSGKSRVHSFGIGDSFDKNLIQKSAKAGRGTANFVNDVEEIGEKVISALQRSIVPCVSKMKIRMAGEFYPRPEKLGNVYYGERYLQYFETDEISENTILFNYHDDFRKKNEEILIGNLKMIEGDFLFKLWAKFRIEHLYENVHRNKNEIKRLSIEAGVPCGLTSFICFKENDEPVIGELKSLAVKTQTDSTKRIVMPASVPAQTPSISGMPPTPPIKQSDPPVIPPRHQNMPSSPSVMESDNQSRYIPMSSSPQVKSYYYGDVELEASGMRPYRPKKAFYTGESSNYTTGITYTSCNSYIQEEQYYQQPPDPPKMSCSSTESSNYNKGISYNPYDYYSRAVTYSEQQPDCSVYSNIDAGPSSSCKKFLPCCPNSRPSPPSNPPLPGPPPASDKPLSNCSYLSEPPNQSMKTAPKTLDYMSIISSQSSKGFWNYDHFILLIPALSLIPQDSLLYPDIKNVYCTIFVLLLLEKTYSEKQSEWVLVMRKAVHWLKALNIDYEEIKESYRIFV